MQIRHFILTFVLVLFTAGIAHAELDAYLHSLNVSAEGDINGFRTRIAAHFDASGPQIDVVFRSVDEPADAAVCFWLAEHAEKPMEVVVREYRNHKGQGWGALAKSLGIKPGSAEFKNLKEGNLGLQPARSAGNQTKGSGKGKGRS